MAQTIWVNTANFEVHSPRLGSVWNVNHKSKWTMHSIGTVYTRKRSDDRLLAMACQPAESDAVPQPKQIAPNNSTVFHNCNSCLLTANLEFSKFLFELVGPAIHSRQIRRLPQHSAGIEDLYPLPFPYFYLALVEQVYQFLKTDAVGKTSPIELKRNTSGPL
jgi:hypothetical protein